MYDSVLALGGPLNVEITREMLKEVKFASQRYKTALEEKRKIQSDSAKRTAAKRKLGAEVESLQRKKRKLAAEKTEELANREKELKELKQRINSIIV